MSYTNPPSTSRVTDGMVIAIMCCLVVLAVLLITYQPEKTVKLVVKDWHCVASHEEDATITTNVGDVPLTIPDTQVVCDHWIRKITRD